MKDPVHDRQENDARPDDEHETGMERMCPREQLPSVGLRSVDGSHAAQQHGYVEEGVAPGGHPSASGPINTE